MSISVVHVDISLILHAGVSIQPFQDILLMTANGRPNNSGEIVILGMGNYHIIKVVSLGCGFQFTRLCCPSTGVYEGNWSLKALNILWD